MILFKKVRYFTILVSITLVFSSCTKEEISSPKPILKPNYSFLVAGHVYGKPSNTNIGLHPPFKSHFDCIKEIENLNNVIYTGDVIRDPDIESHWDVTIADMDELGINYHIAAGNHDRGNNFLDRFGLYYYSFMEGTSLFIILNTHQWEIVDDQKEFLISTLSDIDNVSNIFMFTHELIWWSPDSIFQNIGINHLPNYPGSTNYWAEINPILESTNKPIYLFSGDVGATAASSPYAYYHYNNIHLVASGMGYEVDDNYLVVDVYENDSVKINLVALQGEPDKLGDILDYELP